MHTLGIFSRVKMGIPVPVMHLPDPTRTRGYGSCKGKPAGTVCPQTSNGNAIRQIESVERKFTNIHAIASCHSS